MNLHKKFLKGGSSLLFFLVFKFSPVQAATDCTKVKEIPQAECETLVALYNSTNGHDWNDNPKNNWNIWNVANTPCSWTGVTCSGGHVTGIDREQRELVGTLPNLNALSQLQSINLSNNQLRGTIPNLNALTQLQSINLSNNQLRGYIPNLSALTQLETISLFNNQLSGSIPKLNTLTQLQSLNLSYNQLSRSIPDLSALTQLQDLSLSKNRLSGPIPNLSALTQLQYLDLPNNQLSGPIPDLSTLTHLLHLDLSNNQLSGPIPNLSALTQLQYLYLNTNRLSGPIPDLSTLTRLLRLYLSNNQLSGTIPDLCALTQLWTLALDNNQLCGKIPSSLTRLNYSDHGILRIENNKLTTSNPTLVDFLNNHNPEWTNQTPSPCVTPDPPDCPDTPIKSGPVETSPNLTLTKIGEGTVTGQGLNCGEDCTESYPLKTPVTLTAKPNLGWQFIGWSEGCQGTEAETQIIMNEATSCTATFEKAPDRTLTIQKQGSGTVTASLDGVPNSLHCGDTCTASYPYGTQVTLVATPDSNFRFVKWSGEGCADHTTLTEDKTCHAHFESLSSHTLTLTKTGNGQITSTPAGIDCGPTCTAQFPEGTLVELNATPETDFDFGGWWGDWQQGKGCYGNNPLSLPLDQDTTCHVNFIPGGGTPSLNIWQTSLNFEAPSNTSKVTQTLFFYNLNEEWWWNNLPTAALQLGTLSVDQNTFLLKDVCSNKEIAPWSACHLEVEFHPQTNEPITATLSIPSNDPDTPVLTLPLHGTVCSSADPSQLSVNVYPPQLDFGVQSVGDSSSLGVSLYIGTFDQRCGMPQLDSLQLTGEQASEFRSKNQQCYHGGWGEYTYSSCSATVVFSPTSQGQKRAELNLTFNDPNLQVPSIPIQAQATTETAKLEITPQQLDFGNVSLERSASESITLKNTGQVNLKLKNIHMSGSPAWTISDLWNCYMYSWWSMTPELPPDAQCQITAQFAPTELGNQEGTLTVTSNDPASPAQVSFKGQGVETQDCLDSHITIESTTSGPWGTGSTWNTGTPPTEQDVVRIKGGHTITGITYAKVKTLCIEPQATLESPDERGSPLWIQVTDYIQNKGTVRGKDGANESNRAGCTGKEMLGQESCAYPGASVYLVTGTVVNKWDKREEWWWEGSGGPIRNEGNIIAGKGGNGSQYAAEGGYAIVLGRNTLNTRSGIIRGGEGGQLLDTSNGEAGKGGSTQIWGKLGGPGYLKNYGEIRAGKGGDCHPSASAPQTGGNGGNLWLVSLPDVYLEGSHASGQGGQHCAPLGIDGQEGYIQIEPSVISLTGAHTQVEGGDVTIFGGKDWVLNLSHLDHPVVRAAGNIILAVGEGGMIDLRGNPHVILEAQGQVTLFSDKILLEEGKTLNDVIAASKIVVAPSKILHEVSLTASEKVMGSPGETVPVVVILNNSGPEQDTYALKVTDSKGWPLGSILESVTVEGLSTVEVVFQLTLPTTRGEVDHLHLSAISQADATVSATKDILVGVALDDTEVSVPLLPSSVSSSEVTPVLPSGTSVVEETTSPPQEVILPLPLNNEGNPVPLAQIEEPNTPPLEEVKTSLEEAFLPEIIVSTWTIEGCPTTGFINMVCSNQNQVIRDAVLGSRAILSGGELAGNIDSQGFVSQVTVQAGAVLTGGMLSGYVFNQGTIAEVTFVGAMLQGGTLAGVIRNKSRVGGTLVEVIFAPHARLQGGKLQGRIRGDREAPALLESVKVLKGSILSGVKFGSGVLLEEGVIIEE